MSNSSVFRARYKGQCPVCEEWWQPGDEIYYNFENVLAHVKCPDNTEVPKNTELCNKCFTYHVGECL